MVRLCDLLQQEVPNSCNCVCSDRTCCISYFIVVKLPISWQSRRRRVMLTLDVSVCDKAYKLMTSLPTERMRGNADDD